MKTTSVLVLPKFTAFRGALLKSSILCLLIVTLWNTHSVTAAPAKLDPIVVALPNDTPESLSTNSDTGEPAKQTTSVDVESVSLVELGKQQATHRHGALKSKPSNGLPDYILELNDPDIDGPVDYEPAEDKQALNVIAWDLLPPLVADMVNDKKTFSHKSIATGHNLNAEASQESSQITQTSQLGLRSSIETAHQDKRTGSYYTSTIAPRTTTTRTTTTAKPTTTTTPRTTTTTRRTTTPRTTTTTTTTTAEPDSSEYYRLEAGDSYTLPPWLQDIDDPDLDVAVTFEIPEDINEYNHTIERDLVAPLEPYIDLNNLHVTPPTHHKVATTTARTTTTRAATTTTTTTTTRRPTAPRYQAHWVRAKPSTPQPTIATFNKQFTSLNPSISSSSTNFAQRTTSTTTTTVKPESSIIYYNRQLSSNTAQTDKIGSRSSSSEEDNPKSTNPFLHQFDDGKYKPQQFNRITTSSTTTTTTTTTTPAPLTYEKNPFEATIPPWLKDFDYPGLGPGVPFIYDPNEDESPVDKNILPPSETEEDPDPSSNPNSNPNFSNSQKPQGFTNKFSTSALSLTSSASIPSITTIPFPSAQQTDKADRKRPPHVFVAPTVNEANDDISKKTSTTFNKNFAAPFDTTGASDSSDQQKVPLSADRESFPPFNTIITGSSTAPSKTIFSKSEDGKVITNNIFLNGGSSGSPSTKPIGSSQTATNQEKNSFTTQSSTGSSFTTSGAASAFVTPSLFSSTFGSSSTRAGSKYNGPFGGPPGVLAPRVNGFTGSSTAATKSASKLAVTTFDVTSSPSAKTDNKDKFTGSFGGPPGVLKPYDNVKNR